MTRRHARVAVYLGVIAEALLLKLSRSDNALANRSGSFLCAFACNIAIFDCGHFNVQIDAVEQRAGHSLAIALHLKRPTTAFALQIAKIAARTWIHRRTSINSEGKVTLPAARDTVTFPSSSGCRITSNADLLNSGSSSRKRTPLWATLTSPGFGNVPPPSKPMSLMV